MTANTSIPRQHLRERRLMLSAISASYRRQRNSQSTCEDLPAFNFSADSRGSYSRRATGSLDVIGIAPQHVSINSAKLLGTPEIFGTEAQSGEGAAPSA